MPHDPARYLPPEERELFFYIVDLPYYGEGSCPNWYRQLKMTSWQRIPPWAWDHEGPPTDEERGYWAERIISAMRVESLAADFLKRLPARLSDDTEWRFWLR
jgi:hypothetical protein